MNDDVIKNNNGKQQEDEKDSVNSFRTIHMILAPIGHSTKLSRQTMTNTLAAPSRDCYFESIDEKGPENSTSQVPIDIHTLNSQMNTWKKATKIQDQQQWHNSKIYKTTLMPLREKDQCIRHISINYNRDLDFKDFSERQDRLLHQHPWWERHTNTENTHSMHNIHNTYWHYNSLYKHQMTGHRPYSCNSWPYIPRQQTPMDMTSYLLEVQNNVTDTLHKLQQQSSRDSYMNDLQASTVHNPDDLNSWLLSVEKVTKLTDTDPNEICFANAGRIF